MTATLQILRNGTWCAVPVADLTDAEIERFAVICNPAEGWRWARVLAKELRDADRDGDDDINS